jgi:hypothetical protein
MQRRDIFERHIDDLRRQEREQDRCKKEKQSKLFGSLLDRLHVPSDTLWSQVRPKISALMQEVDEYVSLKSMTLFEQLVHFEDYIKEKEKMDLHRSSHLRTDTLLKEKEDEVRLKDKVNHIFTHILLLFEKEGKIYARMKWQDFFAMLKAFPATKDFPSGYSLVEQCTDALYNPVLKYFDYMETVKLDYFEEKMKLMNIVALRPIGSKSFEDFSILAKSLAVSSHLNENLFILRSFYMEMKSIEEEEQRKEETKCRHAKYDAFKDALKYRYPNGMTPEAKWQEVNPRNISWIFCFFL